jgi:hypothetical protein
MLSRHVDVFAVALITLGLLALSKAPAFEQPDRTPSPSFRNTINIQYYPADQLLSGIESVFLR